MKAYSRETVEIVLEKYNCFDAVRDLVEITDKGIKLSKEGRGFSELAWTPGSELGFECWDENLALPLPCTAKEFAAFLINGPGSAVSAAFGDFDSGLDDGVLKAFGATENSAKELLVSAYQAIRDAAGRMEKLRWYAADESHTSQWRRSVVRNLLLEVALQDSLTAHGATSKEQCDAIEYKSFESDGRPVCNSRIVSMESDYICGLMKSRPKISSKMLHKIITEKAACPDSPFEIGHESMKGLVVHRKSAKPLCEKTLANNMKYLQFKLQT